ncbi:MerR family transcriptional regulator [Deinococcus hohokamensis]|uniref:MerR family transcriptional regulator n=1 Tax=Deinococcus hohokamensis TaxID=309883 RepID=A0ABV9IDN4_9DEIO
MLPIPHNWFGGIEALVDTANQWLEQLLPQDRSLRAKDEVNARLVRHYTTLGLLPAPRREGREARYDRHHLVALLALRRLMSDGLGGRALAETLRDQNPAALERLALHGVGGPESDNPAVAYLKTLQIEAARPSAARSARPQVAPEATDVLSLHRSLPLMRPVESWQRVWVEDGVEVAVRRGTALPRSEAQWRILLQEVRTSLEALEAHG